VVRSHVNGLGESVGFWEERTLWATRLEIELKDLTYDKIKPTDIFYKYITQSRQGSKDSS